MRKLDRLINKKSDFCEKIEDIKDFFWYNPISKYHTYKEMLSRMIYWAYHMRWSWDFDAQTIYSMTYRKLDRIHDCMKNHGNLVWNNDESNNLMRKLCEAKYLAKRLDEFHYDSQAFIETKAKYGHKRWTTKIDGLGYRYHSQWKTDSKNAKLYLKVRGKHYQSMKLNDKKRLFTLLEKYIESWWD